MLRVFQADTSKLPVYVTATDPRGGFTIYRVSKVTSPSTYDEGRLKLAAERMGDQLGRDFASAYLASLRSRSDVKIEQAQLEVKRDDGVAPAPGQQAPVRQRAPRGLPQ